MTASAPLRSLAAVLVLIVGAIHWQQYVDFINEVPTIGVLFLLNGAGGVALAVALLWPDATLNRLAALSGLGLCLGSLVSIILARGGGIFGYQEPDWRGPVVIAVVAEVLYVLVAGGYLARAMKRPYRAVRNGRESASRP